MDLFAANIDLLLKSGALDDALDALEKGAQHKYIRRIPIAGSKGKRKYRYIYSAAHAAHHGAKPEVGEKVKVKDAGQEGHYEVTHVHEDGQVTLKHDETGAELKVHGGQLKDMLAGEHAAKIKAQREAALAVHTQAQKTGTEKQKQRAADALAAIGAAPEAAPLEAAPDVRMPSYDEAKLRDALAKIHVKAGGISSDGIRVGDIRVRLVETMDREVRKTVPYKIEFDIDIDRERVSRTYNLYREHVATKGKSNWVRDNLWRVTPAAIDKIIENLPKALKQAVESHARQKAKADAAVPAPKKTAPLPSKNPFNEDGLTGQESGRLHAALSKRYMHDGENKNLGQMIQEMANKGPLDLQESDGMINYSRSKFNRVDDQDKYMADLKAQRLFWVNNVSIPKNVFESLKRGQGAVDTAPPETAKPEAPSTPDFAAEQTKRAAAMSSTAEKSRSKVAHIRAMNAHLDAATAHGAGTPGWEAHTERAMAHKADGDLAEAAAKEKKAKKPSISKQNQELIAKVQASPLSFSGEVHKTIARALAKDDVAAVATPEMDFHNRMARAVDRSQRAMASGSATAADRKRHEEAAFDLARAVDLAPSAKIDPQVIEKLVGRQRDHEGLARDEEGERKRAAADEIQAAEEKARVRRAELKKEWGPRSLEVSTSARKMSESLTDRSPAKQLNAAADEHHKAAIAAEQAGNTPLAENHRENVARLRDLAAKREVPKDKRSKAQEGGRAPVPLTHSSVSEAMGQKAIDDVHAFARHIAETGTYPDDWASRNTGTGTLMTDKLAVDDVARRIARDLGGTYGAYEKGNTVPTDRARKAAKQLLDAYTPERLKAAGKTAMQEAAEEARLFPMSKLSAKETVDRLTAARGNDPNNSELADTVVEPDQNTFSVDGKDFNAGLKSLPTTVGKTFDAWTVEDHDKMADQLGEEAIAAGRRGRPMEEAYLDHLAEMHGHLRDEKNSFTDEYVPGSMAYGTVDADRALERAKGVYAGFAKEAQGPVEMTRASELKPESLELGATITTPAGAVLKHVGGGDLEIVHDGTGPTPETVAALAKDFDDAAPMRVRGPRDTRTLDLFAPRETPKPPPVPPSGGGAQNEAVSQLDDITNKISEGMHPEAPAKKTRASFEASQGKAFTDDDIAAGRAPYRPGDVLSHEHNSPETAFTIDDYPYGRQTRTQKRVWFDHNKNGTRVMEQTKDPKTDRWNKPKASTYSDLHHATFNSDGRLEHHGWGLSSPGQAAAYLSQFGHAMTEPQRAKAEFAARYHEEMQKRGAGGATGHAWGTPEYNLAHREAMKTALDAHGSKMGKSDETENDLMKSEAKPVATVTADVTLSTHHDRVAGRAPGSSVYDALGAGEITPDARAVPRFRAHENVVDLSKSVADNRAEPRAYRRPSAAVDPEAHARDTVVDALKEGYRLHLTALEDRNGLAKKLAKSTRPQDRPSIPADLLASAKSEDVDHEAVVAYAADALTIKAATDPVLRKGLSHLAVSRRTLADMLEALQLTPAQITAGY